MRVICDLIYPATNFIFKQIIKYNVGIETFKFLIKIEFKQDPTQYKI